MNEIHPAAAGGFSTAADAYERGRPGYPEPAMAWLAERLEIAPGRDVLDLAAGTGKLTRSLVPFGARVIAVEPIDEMREHLFSALPDVEAFDGTAESIPLPDGSVDVVTCGQAFHWFRVEQALPEIHRVLRPDGYDFLWSENFEAGATGWTFAHGGGANADWFPTTSLQNTSSLD